MSKAKKITTPEYIRWLEERSMLGEAEKLFPCISGNGIQWDNPYAIPQTEKAVETASVWFTAYPCATITRKGESILQAFSDEKLWTIFQQMGIMAMHTGPLKRAGGISGYEYTPTVDGWFDRISLNIDPAFGSDKQYRNLVKTAGKFNSIIIGDIIPGHTGKGADFRLAERAYKDYPGLYSMVSINREDWQLLPEVPQNEDTVNLPSDIVGKLKENGYIPGHLQRVLFSVPGKTGLTGWDATDRITGADGIERRWVYLHYFRPGQPTLNWLDPSFCANRLIAGDIIKTRVIFGARIIRLDANPFLGIESIPDAEKTWSEGHPLSVIASDLIAFMMRKLGGWSFQELNLGLGDIKKFSECGPDLAYDFITRPAYNHALLTGDAGFLRLTLRLMDEYGIKPVQLIHAMQNHDEITYELVHFSDNADKKFSFDGEEITGKELRDRIIAQMHYIATGNNAPYNQLSGNGLCTTYTGLCSAAFGIKDPYSMTDEQTELVKKGHLLMALYNAMQPGVFAISGWDLTGALPLPAGEIKELVSDGDYRWINRGAYDIMGINPREKVSSGNIPRAKELYGCLPEQLKDPDSFASRMKDMLGIREKYGIALAKRIEIPEVQNKGVVIMVHKLPRSNKVEITALNFGRDKAEENLKLDILSGMTGCDVLNKGPKIKIPGSGELPIELGALEGKVLVFSNPL